MVNQAFEDGREFERLEGKIEDLARKFFKQTRNKKKIMKELSEYADRQLELADKYSLSTRSSKWLAAAKEGKSLAKYIKKFN